MTLINQQRKIFLPALDYIATLRLPLVINLETRIYISHFYSQKSQGFDIPSYDHPVSNLRVFSGECKNKNSVIVAASGKSNKDEPTETTTPRLKLPALN